MAMMAQMQQHQQQPDPLILPMGFYGRFGVPPFSTPNVPQSPVYDPRDLKEMPGYDPTNSYGHAPTGPVDYNVGSKRKYEDEGKEVKSEQNKSWKIEM